MKKLAQDLVKTDKFVFRGETLTVTSRKATWNNSTQDYTVFTRNARGQGQYIGLTGEIELV